MRRGLWSICLSLIILFACTMSGCGWKSNPSYFPFLLPKGDIIRTHAKPPGIGYHKNFDPHAVTLVVRPELSCSPVQTHQVLIATVYDEKGQPRRDRRVEWMVEGAGHIVEVDESGYVAGRGYKVDNRYAVSYTDRHKHCITRGTEDPHDDIMIRPGQSWCVITSSVEGDTHVTVYAPGIANWKKSKIHVTHHWVNALWKLPSSIQSRVAQPQQLTTHVFRPSDRQALANYRVRYTILDGPPAVFVRGGKQSLIDVTDIDGNANVTLAQVTPQTGINRIGIEVIRAPDPGATSAPGIIIGKGETTVEWLAPDLSLRLEADPNVLVGREAQCRILVQNVGRAESEAVTVTHPIPKDVTLIDTEPKAKVEQGQIVWTLDPIAAQKTTQLLARFRTTQIGSIRHRVTLTSLGKLRDEKTTKTKVTQADLQLKLDAPKDGVVGNPVMMEILVENPGDGPLEDVVLRAKFDGGLESDVKANPIDLELKEPIAPRTTRRIPLKLTPRQSGAQKVTVEAQAAGRLKKSVAHTLNVAFANLSLQMKGPQVRYLNRRADWEILVKNPGRIPLRNVIVKSLLPDELDFVRADENGLLEGRDVVWNLGELKGGESRVVRVSTICRRMGDRILHRAIVVAEPMTDAGAVTQVAGKIIQAEDRILLDVRGLPAFRLNVQGERNPLAVGERTRYRIEVINQGTLRGKDVEIVATLPAEMKFINASGPSVHTVENQRIVFAQRDGLQAKEKWIYEIEAEAIKTGDARLKVDLRAATLSSPVSEEQSTTIFKP